MINIWIWPKNKIHFLLPDCKSPEFQISSRVPWWLTSPGWQDRAGKTGETGAGKLEVWVHQAARAMAFNSKCCSTYFSFLGNLALTQEKLLYEVRPYIDFILFEFQKRIINKTLAWKTIAAEPMNLNWTICTYDAFPIQYWRLYIYRWRVTQ